MPERSYPWSTNKDRSTEYLEDLKEIREKEELPTGRIDDELAYRAAVEAEASSENDSTDSSDD